MYMMVAAVSPPKARTAVIALMMPSALDMEVLKLVAARGSVSAICKVAAPALLDAKSSTVGVKPWIIRANLFFLMVFMELGLGLPPMN